MASEEQIIISRRVTLCINQSNSDYEYKTIQLLLLVLLMTVTRQTAGIIMTWGRCAVECYQKTAMAELEASRQVDRLAIDTNTVRSINTHLCFMACKSNVHQQT